MTDQHHTTDVTKMLRELVAGAKAPQADVEALLIKTEASILKSVPDKPLAEEGRVWQPQQVFETGQALPNWGPHQEKTLHTLEDAVNPNREHRVEKDKKKGRDR